MLEKDITQKLTVAMKSGNKLEVSVYRLVLSAIKNKKIEDRVEELEDDKVIALIQKKARQHKESITQFRDGGREDLVKIEQEELSVIECFLPEQISEEELTTIVTQAIEETGASTPQDMGKVMNAVMGKVQGRADGNVISKMVKEKLV
jgi:uncharacterized protein YqeY